MARRFDTTIQGRRRSIRRDNERTDQPRYGDRNVLHTNRITEASRHYERGNTAVPINNIQPSFFHGQHSFRQPNGQAGSGGTGNVQFSAGVNTVSQELFENRKGLTELDNFRPRVVVAPEQLHQDEVDKRNFVPPLNSRDIVFELLMCNEQLQHETMLAIDDYLRSIPVDKRQEIEISSKLIVGFALSEEYAAKRAAATVAYLNKAVHDVFKFSRIAEWLEYILPCRCQSALLTDIQILNLGVFLLELNKLFQGMQQAEQISKYIIEMSKYFLMQAENTDKPQVKALIEASRPFLMTEEEKIKRTVCMELEFINVSTIDNNNSNNHHHDGVHHQDPSRQLVVRHRSQRRGRCLKGKY